MKNNVPLFVTTHNGVKVERPANKETFGLSDVDNTADKDKPVPTSVSVALTSLGTRVSAVSTQISTSTAMLAEAKLNVADLDASVAMLIDDSTSATRRSGNNAWPNKSRPYPRPYPRPCLLPRPYSCHYTYCCPRTARIRGKLRPTRPALCASTPKPRDQRIKMVKARDRVRAGQFAGGHRDECPVRIQAVIPKYDTLFRVNLDILNQTSGYRKLCLRYTRLVFRVGPKYPSAKSAWNHAQFKHPGDTNPPRGVPVFFSGIFGHVAPSLGGGTVRSTAWPSSNRIGNVTIGALCARWGRTYLGWTEDLNGVRVYSPTTTCSTFTPILTQSITTEDDMIDAIDAQARTSLGRTLALAESDVRVLRVARGQSTLVSELDAIRDSPEAHRFAVTREYATTIGRGVESDTVADQQWVANGGDMIRLHNGLRGVNAATEPLCVVAAYQAILHRDPTTTNIRDWAAGRTVGQVWDGIAAAHAAGSD